MAREVGVLSPLRRSGVTATPRAPEHVAYPLLSGGDVNIYALMVERAARLVRADGIVGLVVPSGIAADLGAADFFRGISRFRSTASRASSAREPPRKSSARTCWR